MDGIVEPGNPDRATLGKRPLSDSAKRGLNISVGREAVQPREWARKGSRPRQPADQRYESAYLFGAICPARGTGAALAMPRADTEAMQAHLDEIAHTVAKRAHGVLHLDRAGWHTTDNLVVPKNMTLIFLPPRSPELKPVEIWQYLRANWLSNRVFETYDDIIDAACDAWNKLIAQTQQLARISQTERCIGALNLRKLFCENDLTEFEDFPDADRV